MQWSKCPAPDLDGGGMGVRRGGETSIFPPGNNFELKKQKFVENVKSAF